MIDFKRDINIGGARAESDKLLNNNFITIPAFSKLYSDDPSIIIGRKGSGKSGLRLHFSDTLFEKKSNLYCAHLTPRSEEFEGVFEYAMRISNSGLVTELFSLLWECAAHVQLLRTLSHELPQIQSRREASELLVDFYPNSLANPHGKSSSAIDTVVTEHLSIEKMREFRQRSRSQLKEICKREDIYLYLLVDSIDDLLHNSTDSSRRDDVFSTFFSGLIDFFRDFTDFRSNPSCERVLFKLFMPVDIYNWSSNRHADQLSGYKYEVSWAYHELENFIRLRLSENLSGRDKKIASSMSNEAFWSSFLPLSAKFTYYDASRRRFVSRSVPTVTHLMNMTLRRPRDIMLLFRHINALCQSHGVPNPDPKILNMAIDAYSEDLRSNVVEEYKRILPEIDKLFGAFAGTETRVRRDDFEYVLSTKLQNAEEVELASRVLYEAGLFGVETKHQSTVSSKYSYDSVPYSNVTSYAEYIFHPAFRSTMQLKSVG